ncbi:right-handed parallel beta-helix repeat-containing protein [Tichowtungia aerotolerans]|uniref:Right-handed parallel beta-helix repeat-containing protein n=1 Tax=Tichowtungia aerotolerans TaxID=2697043 RepID=A0A6P1M8U7_9BACT|nr:right-handed parallel beta-helix repeat-containing protein [Tichowtungia aerotolerans]QHI70317.1 right-handed parallel beta-helix repeat-containing protein [Tichowtungia aerotolerans]
MTCRKLVFVLLLAGAFASADTYYVDSESGDDQQSGTSEAGAWKSLARIGESTLAAGDQLLLKRGCRFEGALKISVTGTEKDPVVIGAYGNGPAPVIDAKGYPAGICLVKSHYVTVKDLEISADGGSVGTGQKDRRYGVYVQGIWGGTSHITLDNLTIYKIYPETGSKHEGINPTSYIGTGILIQGGEKISSTGFVVKNCRISDVGFKAIELKNIEQVDVLDNFMKDIGGPAIQPGNVNDLVVRGNTVDGSGSFKDPRMHGRGSGIWPWTCSRVLIEKNRFMHARGPGDSCGIHIDFNCSDVVVQYNLSVDNEGGFVEILGNNHNCAYRYNISINDGARVKGIDGAFQEGKILWTSGFVGSKKEKHGPYNSYIYNNTVYIKEGSRSCFSFTPTTDGLLVANNIFYILGQTRNVSGDQTWGKFKTKGPMQRAVIENNLYARLASWPADLEFRETDMTIGDPQFARPGGLNPEDYIPQNAGLIRNQGTRIKQLAGDEVGLRIGLDVKEDFFGNPIVGNPDLGAVEMIR